MTSTRSTSPTTLLTTVEKVDQVVRTPDPETGKPTSMRKAWVWIRFLACPSSNMASEAGPGLDSQLSLPKFQHCIKTRLVRWLGYLKACPSSMVQTQYQSQVQHWISSFFCPSFNTNETRLVKWLGGLKACPISNFSKIVSESGPALDFQLSLPKFKHRIIIRLVRWLGGLKAKEYIQECWETWVKFLVSPISF